MSRIPRPGRRDHRVRTNSVTGKTAMSTVSRPVTAAAALLVAVLSAAPAPAAATVPIALSYAGTFTVTPQDPSSCAGVPLTDTLTGTGSHLGRSIATYPHCVNFSA